MDISIPSLQRVDMVHSDVLWIVLLNLIEHAESQAVVGRGWILDHGCEAMVVIHRLFVLVVGISEVDLGQDQPLVAAELGLLQQCVAQLCSSCRLRVIDLLNLLSDLGANISLDSFQFLSGYAGLLEVQRGGLL